MNPITVNVQAARRCLQDSSRLIGEGRNEQVIRDSFTSRLRQIFPETPGWIERHIESSESPLAIVRDGGTSTRFVDNLIDLTAIEYESDLRIPTKYQEGLGQVRDYCSRVIVGRGDPELVLGILSDTLRWFAYKVDTSNLTPEIIAGGGDLPIQLIQIEAVDFSDNSERSANDLIRFLIKHLGRIGARPVTATSIAKDLGFQSRFAQEHIQNLSVIIHNSFTSNPRYANLIAQLWSNFVSYLREAETQNLFEITTYIDEYYISLVGKLICANYLEGRAMNSGHAELIDILKGSFFENKGLINFVEYDYFGWLNTPPHVLEILPIAEAIQQDLIAYDFTVRPAEDLFGHLMTQLANRSQRVLLGQEWTPEWLSQRLVTNVVSSIPDNSPAHILDMCCGSGSMLVKTLHLAKIRITRLNPESTREEKAQLLIQSITGFDIDPLAVMLSKINWVLASMDWIQPLGTIQVIIPVYHADSLFAVTAISENSTSHAGGYFKLRIAEYEVNMPDFLISPECRSFFDRLINLAYRVVVHLKSNPLVVLNNDTAIMHIRNVAEQTEVLFDEGQFEKAKTFFVNIVSVIDVLNKDDRNGIWMYIIRNGFRPGLMAGQFNGLVSNPPWLALSKLANNPYKTILTRMAIDFKIKPAGSSHLHIELATIFLLHAIKQYLMTGAQIGCILPQTILNGAHHHRFRSYNFLQTRDPIPLSIHAIWRIEEHTFKNNALILFGTKTIPDNIDAPIAGRNIFSQKADEETVFQKIEMGTRSAWSEDDSAGGREGAADPFGFRQGVDIMPRTLFFYEAELTQDRRHYNMKSIDPLTSPNAFSIKEGKKFRDFFVTARIMPEYLFFDALTSNLLTPFHLAACQKVLLPIRKDATGKWEQLSDAQIMAAGPATQNTFESIGRIIQPNGGNVTTIFNLLNTRRKLEQQVIPPEGYLILTGAGGSNVCSTYIDSQDFDTGRLVIDQTLYWVHVDSEDEAIYLSGLLNSQAISTCIQSFQPQGDFGERHIHKLPFQITPVFDPMNQDHRNVVNTTRAVIQQYSLINNTPEFIELLNPNSSPIHVRRRKLLSQIRALARYPAYESACRAVYGL